MARRNSETDGVQAEEEVMQGPRGKEDGPPSHEETLGALAGAPEEVAQEYAETGTTPDGEWRKRQTEATDTGVDPEKQTRRRSR